MRMIAQGCEYHTNREQSVCLRPVVARVLSVTRGAIWLCAPHVETQKRHDQHFLQKEADRIMQEKEDELLAIVQGQD